MIHAHIDDPTTKNIVGFECGTRADFTAHHAVDPYWVFLDYDAVKYRLPLPDFLTNPTLFYIDDKALVQKKTTRTIVVETTYYLTDSDGVYLTDADGELLFDAVSASDPFTDFYYIVDSDGVYLTGDDGIPLTEPM